MPAVIVGVFIESDFYTTEFSTIIESRTCEHDTVGKYCSECGVKRAQRLRYTYKPDWTESGYREWALRSVSTDQRPVLVLQVLDVERTMSAPVLDTTRFLESLKQTDVQFSALSLIVDDDVES